MPAPHPPSEAERERRWSAVASVMKEADVDAVIAHSDLGDHRGEQRYLSGFRSIFDDVATVLFADGSAAMVVANPGVVGFAQHLSWIDEVVVGAKTTPWLVGDSVNAPSVSAFSIGAELALQCKRRGITRIGLADGQRLHAGWRADILHEVPEATFVDLKPAIDRLRLVKSPEEIGYIRTACNVADDIWTRVAEYARPGRLEFEVLADLHHEVLAAGCEDAYNMFFSLPLFANSPVAAPSVRRVEVGDACTVEVSPRYNGYYGQLTSLVSFGPPAAEMVAAYEAINRGRESGLALMKPGNDLTQVTAAVEQQLAGDGYQLASPLTGHFVGLELEEPRAGAEPLTLESGMVFIFHPFIAGWPALMRADTYLVTDDGAERLTALPLDPIVL